MIKITDMGRNWSSMEFTSEVEPTKIICRRSLKWAQRIEVGDIIPVTRLKNYEILWRVNMRVMHMKLHKDSINVVLEAV